MTKPLFPTAMRTVVSQWCGEADTVCKTCRATTPGCCTQMVSMSSVEAAHIIYTETVQVRASLDRLLALSAHEARVAAGADLQDIINNDLDAAEALLLDIAARWWPERRSCAFLTKAGRCGVYQSRPGACITHNLMEGTPADCGDDEVKKLGYLNVNTAKALLIKDTVVTDVIVGGVTLPFTLHMGMATAILSVLWWLHNRQRKPQPSRKQLEHLLDHLPRAIVRWTGTEPTLPDAE